MSTQSKKINHKFNIGDYVFILHDYTIISCLIIGISCSPIYKPSINMPPTIDENTISYKLIKIIRSKNKNSQTTFNVTLSEYDRYDYHSSKVYKYVSDLLSDLEKTTEIS